MGNGYTFREIVRILRHHDPRFEIWQTRGKSGGRVIFHPDVGGRSEAYPVKSLGRRRGLDDGIVRDLLRRFQLPKDLFS